ncbi:hypothetical protein D9M71_205570 [compost metagenome]
MAALVSAFLALFDGHGFAQQIGRRAGLAHVLVEACGLGQRLRVTGFGLEQLLQRLFGKGRVMCQHRRVGSTQQQLRVVWLAL